MILDNAYQAISSSSSSRVSDTSLTTEGAGGIGGLRCIASNIVFTHVLCILLGAPIIDRAPQTLLFSVLFVLVGGRPMDLYFDERKCDNSTKGGVEAMVEGEQSGGNASAVDASGAHCGVVAGRRPRGAQAEGAKAVTISAPAVDDHNTSVERPPTMPCGYDDAGRDVGRRREGDMHTITLALCAWLGGILAPLDWDVWYQEWPVPSTVLLMLAVVALRLPFVQKRVAGTRWNVAQKKKNSKCLI
jgi:hypothetical protein